MPKRTRAETPAPEAGALLTLADILVADDVETETVAVPEWGGSVRLAALTGKERFALIGLMDQLVKDHGNDLAGPKSNYLVVAMSMVDADGARLPDPVSSAEQLESKDFAVIERLYAVCRRLSALGEDKLEERVEELGETGPSGDSSTD